MGKVTQKYGSYIIIDHFTGYSVSGVIKAKRKEEIMKQVFRIWVSIFGAPKKFLIDNGGGFNNFAYSVKM